MLEFQEVNQPAGEYEVFTGKIVDTATKPGELVLVTLPAFAAGLAHGPCPWSPVVTAAGLFFPHAGEACQVSQPVGGDPWIVDWTPKDRAPDVTASRLLSGVGAPDSSFGFDGDFYLDAVTWLLYGPKASGVWPAGVLVKSPGEATVSEPGIIQLAGDLRGTATMPLVWWPGMILPYGGASAPSGWYVCDGGQKSRTTDASLFAAIGTTFGAGNGSSTFNLPDLRGRTVIGVAGGHALAATGGAETHQLVTAELPNHGHGKGTLSADRVAGHTHGSGTLSAASDGAHTHPIRFNNQTASGANSGYRQVVSGLGASDNSTPTATGGEHTHSITGSTGSGGGHGHDLSGLTGMTGADYAHNNMQPFITLNYIIKA